MRTNEKAFSILPGVLAALLCFAAVVPTHAQIKPRQPDSQITDKGIPNLQSGWYDAQCQGANNDYCRYVGPQANPYWSCALAGGTSQYTPQGQYQQESTFGTPCPSGSYIPVDPTACSTAVAQPGFDWVNEIATVLENAISFIPEVGPIISATLNVVWPIVDSNINGGGSTRDISDCAWTAITSYVQQYVSKALDTVLIKNLQDTLKGLQNAMAQYIQDTDSLGWRAGSKILFVTLYEQFVQYNPTFSDTQYFTPSTPGNVLPILMPWVTMHVGMAQEYYCNQTLYDGQANAERRAFQLQYLNETIANHIQTLQGIQANITQYESTRYQLLDWDWPNQHKTWLGGIVDTGNCDNLPNEVCNGNAQGITSCEWQEGCANTDLCTCYYGYVVVSDRYLGASAGGNGLSGQATWQWWQVWFGGGIEGGPAWRTPAVPGNGNFNVLPMHSDAVSTGNSNLASITAAHNAHVAYGLQNSVGKLVSGLQALQTQLATDATKICGPDSDVVQNPLPPVQLSAGHYTDLFNTLVATAASKHK